MEALAQFFQQYGPWGVSALFVVLYGMERRERMRLQQQVLDEAHATTELAEKDAQTWQAALGLLQEIRDSLGKGRGGR